MNVVRATTAADTCILGGPWHLGTQMSIINDAIIRKSRNWKYNTNTQLLTSKTEATRTLGSIPTDHLGIRDCGQATLNAWDFCLRSSSSLPFVLNDNAGDPMPKFS